MSEWIIGALVAWWLMSILGGWIADQKGRDIMEGIVLGQLFGPVGVLVEALLPSVKPPGSSLRAPE